MYPAILVRRAALMTVLDIHLRGVLEPLNQHAYAAQFPSVRPAPVMFQQPRTVMNIAAFNHILLSHCGALAPLLAIAHHAQHA